MNITHQPDRQRFVATVDGGGGELAYRRVEPHTLSLYHTEVTPSLRGQGIAGKLVEAAIAHARANGDRIIPSCPYVHDWLEKHPEHLDLVAGRSDITTSCPIDGPSA